MGLGEKLAKSIAWSTFAPLDSIRSLNNWGLVSTIHTRVCKTKTVFRLLDQKWLKSILCFRRKRLKNHTLWRCTNLRSLYRGVPPSRRRRHRSCKTFCLYLRLKWFQHLFHFQFDISPSLLLRLQTFLHNSRYRV